MALTLQEPPTESVPLQTDPHGAIRVTGTRVTLDTVIAAYERGARAEDIARQFDVLHAGDVHAVLAYYFRHRQEVDEYLRQRRATAEIVRAEIERRSPSDELRERVRRRRLEHSGQPDQSS